MQVGVLGPLEVVDEGRPVPVNGARTRALLSILALNAGVVVSNSRLVDELWGKHPPAKAANALQARVSQLRRLLGSGRLVARSPGYLLDVAPEGVDAIRFEHLGARGRAALGRGELDGASSTLRDALALWRGPALAGLAESADGDLIALEASRLEELRLAVLEDRIEADLALGSQAEVTHELRALVAEHPLRERLWGQLMIALYRSERQADALAVYQQARAALADELGLNPGPELQRLEAAILTHDANLAPAPPPRASAVRLPLAAPPGNLRPSLTSFVGREEDRRRVRKLLEESRLVTLTGPGGSGKTRLAQEVGAEVSGSFPDGVWVVELAGVADPEAVTTAVASALGRRDSAMLPLAGSGGSLPTLAPLHRLLEHLDQARVLLVLDNCEHLVAEVGTLAETLLRTCPSLRILATSREPLGIGGETQWPVAPLPVPTLLTDLPEGVAGSPSVRLFADRAAAVVPSFTLSADTAPVVAEICRRLDGLPLAIELAAVKVKSLPLVDIAARLDNRFGLLGGPRRGGAARQQSLRALVDWSYDLLAGDERTVFEALSCFAGGATLAAAEEVCATGTIEAGHVVDILACLVDKSLVVADLGHPVGPRYELLETLRQYGQEKLGDAGHLDEVRGRHARHFLILAEAGSFGVRGRDQRQWLARLDTEHDNLRAALDWAVSQQRTRLALGLARALGWFWYLHGPRQEAMDRLATVLGLPVESPTDRAGVLGWAGFLAFCSFDLPRASACCEENLRLCFEVGDDVAIALAQGLCALVEMHLGAVERASALLDEAAATFVRVGDEWGLAATRFVAAVLAVGHDVEQGERLAGDALGRFRALGDGWGVLHCLSALSQAAEVRGEYAQAGAFVTEALTVGTDLGLDDEVANLQAQIGNLAVLRGERQRHEWLRTEAATPSRRFGLAWVAYLEDGRGTTARRRGDLVRARVLHEQALAIYRELELTEGAALALSRLGALAELDGDLEVARARHAESLGLMVGQGERAAVALSVEGMAAVAVAGGDAERAATLLGAAAVLRQAARSPLPPTERLDVERAQAATRAGLDDEAYALAVERGRALSCEEAVDLALAT